MANEKRFLRKNSNWYFKLSITVLEQEYVSNYSEAVKNKSIKYHTCLNCSLMSSEYSV